MLNTCLRHKKFRFNKKIKNKKINISNTHKKEKRKKEIRVQSLDQEDPLEEKMATHSSILS